jgi:hypothetical protein
MAEKNKAIDVIQLSLEKLKINDRMRKAAVTRTTQNEINTGK